MRTMDDRDGAVPSVPRPTCSTWARGAWNAARYADARAQPFPPGHPERLGAISR